MLTIQRANYILTELREHKAVRVTELAKKYYVSSSTIRRDLNALASEGLIRRTYGGAVLMEHSGSEIPFKARINEKQTEKNVIGKLAAQLVKDDQFILLDGTSTVAHMLRYLTGKTDLRILTTSAQVSLDCLDYLPNVKIYCTGGSMNPYL